MFSPAQSSKVSSSPVAIRNFNDVAVDHLFNTSITNSNYVSYPYPLRNVEGHNPGRSPEVDELLGEQPWVGRSGPRSHRSAIRDPIPRYTQSENERLSFRASKAFDVNTAHKNRSLVFEPYHLHAPDEPLNSPGWMNPPMPGRAPSNDVPIVHQQFNKEFLKHDPTVSMSRCANGIQAVGQHSQNNYIAQPLDTAQGLVSGGPGSTPLPVGPIPLSGGVTRESYGPRGSRKKSSDAPLKTGRVYVNPNSSKSRRNKEGFTTEIADEADEMYLRSLIVRAKAVADYVAETPDYQPWTENWKLLKKNLDKTGYLFERLADTDEDVAYVINKGEEVKFRIRDQAHYVPLNIYQYVLYHEMAHMSTEELQHTPKFMELLAILSLAAFQLGFIDVRRLTEEYYTSDGSPILCKASLKEEITDGCMHLINQVPGRRTYYSAIMSAVASA